MNVEMPDGTVITDVPEGTTKAQIAAKYKAHIALTTGVTPSHPPPAPVPTPYGDSPLTNFGIGWQGVGEGAANVAGLPVDLTTLGINKLAIDPYDIAARTVGFPNAQIDEIHNPVGGAQSIKNLASDVANFAHYPIYDPARMNEPQKLGYSIDDYGTQAAALGSAGLAMAPARAAEIATGSVPKLGDAFVRPYLQGGSRALVGDAAGGVGAGTGHYVAQREFPNSPLVDMLGTLAGGGGGATALAAGEGLAGAASSALEKGIKGNDDPNIFVDKKTFLPTTNSEANQAATILQGMAFDPRQAATDLQTRVVDLRNNDLPLPTSGIGSGDPGLRSAEMGARTKNPAPFMANDAKLRQTATDKVSSLQDPGADQGAVVAAAAGAREAALATPQSDLALAEKVASESHEKDVTDAVPLRLAQGSETRVGASKTLDNALLAGKVAPARAAKNAAFDALDPNSDQMVDASPLLDLVGKIRTQSNALAPSGLQMPGEFMQRLEALAPDMQPKESAVLDASGKPIAGEENVGGTGQTSLRSLVDMRKYLAPAEDAARKSGNFELADNIRALRNGVNTTIEETPAAADANAVYKEQFVPVARSGGATEDLVRNVERDPNRSVTPASQTAQTLMGGPGTLAAPEHFADLKKVLDHIPTSGDNTAGEAGGKAAADYVRSSFAKSVLNDDGTINYKRAQRWAQNNQAALNEFPDSAAEIAGYVAKARSGAMSGPAIKKGLMAARGNLADTQDSVDRSAVGTLLKAQDPRDVAEKIFSGASWGAGKQLDQIKAAIGSDPAAQRGWKAAVADVIANKVSGLAKVDSGSVATGETYRVELGKLEKLFKDNGDTLAKVFTPEEMNTLRQAHKVLEPLSNANATATAGPNTAEKFAAIKKLYEIAVRARYGALEGGSMTRKLKMILSQLPDDKNAVDKLVQRAWFDPELAGYLLNKKLPEERGPLANYLVNRIMGAGVLARGGDIAQKEPSK